ncbi:hypothetical_protein-conserved [Leishmania infantum]|uniref:Hypothetical_protein-conserved n=1 Tax=Leishmania infantum TaxID=5671 RepID=A0A6L0XBN3_LEIIN|nr:hypothetical_protein-conserved [Leishmania infantum]SUZ41395.1 hypothetical_protein-conserved [Leishmania infantum]
MQSCCFSKCYHTESGSMARSYFHSSETGAVENLPTGRPPSHHMSSRATQRYPAPYLQNGLGGNESELFYQGKVNIADAKMTEMIISMDNGMMYDDDDVLDPLGYKRGLDQDVISYMDASYRVFPEGADHIMVGLPMRSAQATCAAMQHSELLPAVGILCSLLQIETQTSRRGVLHQARANPHPHHEAMKFVLRAIVDASRSRPLQPLTEAEFPTGSCSERAPGRHTTARRAASRCGACAPSTFHRFLTRAAAPGGVGIHDGKVAPPPHPRIPARFLPPPPGRGGGRGRRDQNTPARHRPTPETSQPDKTPREKSPPPKNHDTKKRTAQARAKWGRPRKGLEAAATPLYSGQHSASAPRPRNQQPAAIQEKNPCFKVLKETFFGKRCSESPPPNVLPRRRLRTRGGARRRQGERRKTEEAPGWQQKAPELNNNECTKPAGVRNSSGRRGRRTAAPAQKPFTLARKTKMGPQHPEQLLLCHRCRPRGKPTAPESPRKETSERLTVAVGLRPLSLWPRRIPRAHRGSYEHPRRPCCRPSSEIFITPQAASTATAPHGRSPMRRSLYRMGSASKPKAPTPAKTKAPPPHHHHHHHQKHRLAPANP